MTPRARWLRPPTPLDPEGARDYALELLARRAHTVQELRHRLVRRGIGAADADALVGRLHELGLLDDRAFARAYVASRARERGVLALRHELRRKGVAEMLVDEALAERDEHAEVSAASRLLAKHAWRFQASDVLTRRAAAGRAFAMLARRGFAPDVAREAVERTLGTDDD